jgi:hypothetical protein
VYVGGGTFTMTGGEITGNIANYGGGVYIENGAFILGGTAVIVGNTPQNVFLYQNAYITLGTGEDAPVSDSMNVGVQTQTPDGVIVEYANPGDEQYFFVDEPGKAVMYENGMLVIKEVSYSLSASPSPISFGAVIASYMQPAWQEVTITKTGTGTVTLTQPTSTYYEIGWLSTDTLVANGATATFWIQPKADLPAGTYNEIIRINGGGTSTSIDVSFTVIPEGMIPVEVLVPQTVIDGNYWFSPVELLGTGYKYKIASRPAPMGGSAPFIDGYGQFVFGHQIMPVNISRAGEYVVEVSNYSGNVVAVFVITVQ